MTDDNAHTLLAAERHALVLEALAREGAVRISQLVEELQVTPVTLRRDLAQMEQAGLLQRVHGGAVATAGSPSAAAASPGDARTIAVLVPSLNYYWPGVVRGIEAEARARGLRVVLRGASYELQDERPVLERLVAGEHISGLIVAPNPDTPHAQDVIQWLHDSGLPTVLVERDAVVLPGGEPVESVTTDHALGAVLAARHLADLGHRRVGLVMSRNSPTSRKIAAGWHRAVAELDIMPSRHVETILPDRSSPGFTDEVNAALDSMMDAEITGLLVHSDPEAMAVVDLALNRGISVPDDLSIVAYDDEVAQLFTPALTAISPPRASVGRTAIDQLIHRIGSPDRPVHRVQLSPQLIVRESTAKPRG